MCRTPNCAQSMLATALLLAAAGSGALLPRPARPQSKLSRREWVGLCGGALLLPRRANAASADAAVTDRVLLEFVQQVSSSNWPPPFAGWFLW